MMDPLLLNTGDGACRTTKNTNLKQQEEGAMLALGGAGSPTVCKLCKINEGCVHTSLTDVKNNQEKGNYKIGYREKGMFEAVVSNHSVILTHNSTCMVIKYAGFRGCNCFIQFFYRKENAWFTSYPVCAQRQRRTCKPPGIKSST